MNLIATLVIGFSVIASVILYMTYAFFLHNVNKSLRALLTGALLLGGLSVLQLGHLDFIQQGTEPLASVVYRIWLFMTPSMFYLFSRSILFDETKFSVGALVHLASLLLLLIPKVEIAISILFCIGTGYSLWLGQVIYSLRNTRRRSGFELFFVSFFSLLAVGVLVLGFSLPYIDPAYFYHFYIFSIGAALMLVVAALLSFPELLIDLAEATKASYANSTLNGIDVAAKKQGLEQLMQVDKVYQDQDLSLASVAEHLQLSTHQLSELINTHFRMSFSRFVREYRIREAERLLLEEPTTSVLAISLEVGFKSQSNFYAAFKQTTGKSPGAYRRPNQKPH